jgi:hypothetical protein
LVLQALIIVDYQYDSEVSLIVVAFLASCTNSSTNSFLAISFPNRYIAWYIDQKTVLVLQALIIVG